MTSEPYDDELYDWAADDEDQGDDSGARVYQLRRGEPAPSTAGAELVGVDVERDLADPGQWRGPVDADQTRPTLYATVTDRGMDERAPVVPAWVRSRTERRVFARSAVREVCYHVGFHTLRSPKYGLKVAYYAPRGVLRLIGRQLRWWWLVEQHQLRQDAATANDPQTWLKLHHEVRVVRRWRGTVLAGELVALTVGGLVLALAAPRWALLVAAAMAVPVLALLGRPADRQITDRVYAGPRFVRLHASMVRAAMVAIGVIKDPADLTFPQDIHADGPGWLARVNLPAGVEAVKVLERRAGLSSALRLPIDQVWPEAGPDHAGQVDLWVSRLPMSKMGRPRWALLDPAARTSVFRAVDFGHDPRLRPVRVPLFARNFLIGGVPGSGKSYGARALALAALLDPTCELKIAEFKGTGDFTDMAELASTYICGIDDRALDEGGALIAWGLAEAERRAARLLRFKKAGLAPEGKVTPELAARPGSGLHPVVIVVDEAHELFAHDKDIAADAERLIKRGRALGLILVLATQVPDAKSVPANITRCVTVRWCMAVRGQVENDMILGTGAYKRGLSATSFRPGDDEDPRDAGLGVMVGLAHSAPAVRSYYPTQAETVALLRRAAQLRGGVLVASEGGPAARDVLDDVRGVFYAGEVFVSWQTITGRLAEQLPEHYGSMTVEAIGARVRGLGVATTDGRDRALGGKALKGAALVSVQAAIEARQIGAGS